MKRILCSLELDDCPVMNRVVNNSRGLHDHAGIAWWMLLSYYSLWFIATLGLRSVNLYDKGSLTHWRRRYAMGGEYSCLPVVTVCGRSGLFHCFHSLRRLG